MAGWSGACENLRCVSDQAGESVGAGVSQTAKASFEHGRIASVCFAQPKGLGDRRVEDGNEPF